MIKPLTLLFPFFIIVFLSLNKCSPSDDPRYIVPQTGYEWPDNNREYWPTDGWLTAEAENHGFDRVKLDQARDFASNDDLARALLVIKDGYLVSEDYYDEGSIDASTNLWSVTKSYASAITGLIWDDNLIDSTDQLMIDLMPQYPEFEQITLQHVLTHTTGLSWNEEGPLWVQWILSDDWVTEALTREHLYEPGTHWKYSSGNTHFLSALVTHRSGLTPGQLAKTRLFDPMGIEFMVQDPPLTYSNWPEYIEILPQSWHQDPQGNETASFGLFQTARDMAKFGYLYLNRGRWENQQLLSEEWVKISTKDHETNIYGRYSYGYQWYLTLVDDKPTFLASGFGGQIIGVVPSLDLVVVLKYEAETPEHPVSGTAHDDMGLFELVVKAVIVPGS